MPVQAQLTLLLLRAMTAHAILLDERPQDLDGKQRFRRGWNRDKKAEQDEAGYFHRSGPSTNRILSRIPYIYLPIGLRAGS